MNGLKDVGFLLCMVLIIAAGAGLLWARLADRADAHLIHCSGCPDCEDQP